MPFNSFDDYPMSWRPVLRRVSGQPLYVTLAQQLEEDIEKGILKPGTKLPPQRELADFLDIGLSTVARAFRICSDKGLLNGSIGSGTFISYHMMKNMDLAEANILDLGSIMPEISRQDEIRSIVEEMLPEPEFDDAFQYLKGTETWQRKAGAALLSRVNCAIEPEQILFASGGQNALAGILFGLFRPGDRLGVDPLVYSGIITLAALAGIRLVPIAQKNGEMSEEGIRQAVKKDGIKGLYLIPNCQNPTMHRMSEECRGMIASVAKEYDLIVIEDGFSALLTDQPGKAIFQRAPEQGIFFLSLSKSISPALRQSYMAAGERYRSRIEDAIYNINLDQSGLLMEISARLILSERFERLVARRREILRQRNAIAEKILGQYELHGGAEALCKWLVLPEGLRGEELEKEALARNVSLYGAEHFAVGKETPLAGARLAISTPRSNEELEQALLVIRDILESRKL